MHLQSRSDAYACCADCNDRTKNRFNEDLEIDYPFKKVLSDRFEFYIITLPSTYDFQDYHAIAVCVNLLRQLPMNCIFRCCVTPAQ